MTWAFDEDSQFDDAWGDGAEDRAEFADDRWGTDDGELGAILHLGNEAADTFADDDSMERLGDTDEFAETAGPFIPGTGQYGYLNDDNTVESFEDAGWGQPLPDIDPDDARDDSASNAYWDAEFAVDDEPDANNDWFVEERYALTPEGLNTLEHGGEEDFPLDDPPGDSDYGMPFRGELDDIMADDTLSDDEFLERAREIQGGLGGSEFNDLGWSDEHWEEREQEEAEQYDGMMDAIRGFREADPDWGMPPQDAWDDGVVAWDDDEDAEEERRWHYTNRYMDTDGSTNLDPDGPLDMNDWDENGEFTGEGSFGNSDRYDTTPDEDLIAMKEELLEIELENAQQQNQENDDTSLPGDGDDRRADDEDDSTGEGPDDNINWRPPWLK